jgi:hypothetical protein
MHHTQMRTVPHLAQLTFGILVFGGLLFAGLVWSMFR